MMTSNGKFTQLYDRLSVRLAVVLIAGMVANAAFAPVGVFPLVFFSLAILFRQWACSSPRESALLGFAFGFGLFGIGVSWVYTSVHDFGNASILFSTLAVVALAITMATFVALCGYVQARFKCSKTLHYLAWIPALWVLTEWLRGWLFGGFPWLYVGYSQTDTWLANWSTYVGVLGVSLSTSITAGGLALLSYGFVRNRVVGTGVVVLVIWGAGVLVGNMNWVKPVSPPVKAGLVQGNVSIHDKWDPKQASLHLKKYISLSQNLADRDLIVWPETALAYTDLELADTAIWEFFAEHPSDFLVGLIEHQQSSGEDTYFNSVFGISDRIQVYRKRQLVPFGEYTPFRPVLQFLSNFVDIPMSDMKSYKQKQAPMQLAGQRIGLSICYEDAFSRVVRTMLPDATLLVNVSEDAWFGTGIAPGQRIQMSRMRAMETGRPVLRVANQGISAAIDHNGNVNQLLLQSEGNVLNATIQPMSGTTPYVMAGDITVLVLCVVLIAIASGFSRQNRTGTQPSD